MTRLVQVPAAVVKNVVAASCSADGPVAASMMPPHPPESSPRTKHPDHATPTPADFQTPLFLPTLTGPRHAGLATPVHMPPRLFDRELSKARKNPE
jgi:hypothetical protein